MSDVITTLYRLRDMTGLAADNLRAAIADAQKVLDRLDDFTDGYEHVAQLAASSDRFPNYSADVPTVSGLTHNETDRAAEKGDE